MQLQNCSGLELKILRSVGEGGIEKWQWRCARGEAGETERDTETDSHSNGALSKQNREQTAERSRAAGWSRAVGHGDRGRKRQRKKLGLVGDMSKDFCPRGTRFVCHGTIIKLPRQGARKTATPSSSRPYPHHSSVTPPPAIRAQRTMHSRSRGCRLSRPILVERNRPVGRSRSSSAV